MWIGITGLRRIPLTVIDYVANVFSASLTIHTA